jgi:hypothetical protein
MRETNTDVVNECIEATACGFLRVAEGELVDANHRSLDRYSSLAQSVR